MNGTVKNKTDRGFGFISREGEVKDLFFHSKDLSKGPSAKNVKRA
jgi:CspA family cold shock protein